MMTIVAHKANSLATMPTNPVQIVVSEEPTGNTNDQAIICKAEADLIESALAESLPRPTYENLVANMLQRIGREVSMKVEVLS